VAATEFQDNPDVLAVCAHNQHGQGWDERGPARDEDADQDTVRLLPYFNPWCWGTWRDRWEKILEPEWDKDCASGGPADSGYDWNVQLRILPRHGMLCVVPDASRSQNIGALEGWASSPEIVARAQSRSFRREREPGERYRLLTSPAGCNVACSRLGVPYRLGAMRLHRRPDPDNCHRCHVAMEITLRIMHERGLCGGPGFCEMVPGKRLTRAPFAALLSRPSAAS